ncbi:hypothetical protein C8F01DRAFT_1137133 [Mycena amicta]|nr:hypothetical protein C8F01DRAFT_1137133 [Mycena amicta]
MSLCSKCATTLVPEEVFTPDAIRSRLAELELLIDTLIAERDHLLAKSKAIAYPVLSLPTEITAQIFRHCVDAAKTVVGRPDPHPFEAPLLLLRICREWRTIALGTAILWAHVSVGNDLAPDILDLWLEHAKPYPLDLYLDLQNPSLAPALLAVCIKYAASWRVIHFGVPLIAYPQLAAALVQEDFVLPMLFDAAFHIHHIISDQVLEDIVAIRNAPALSNLVIGTHPLVQMSAPWAQLVRLQLTRVLLGACLRILAQCAALEEFRVNISAAHDPSPIVAASADKPLVLPSVKILTCALNAHSLLPHVTLPALTQLTTPENKPEITDSVLSSFIDRSGPPPLRRIHLCITSFPSEALLRTLEALPDSVDDAEFTIESEETLQPLFDTLLLERTFPSRFRVFPRLATLRLQTERFMTPAHYGGLLHLLQARSQISELVVLQRTYFAGVVDPSNEVIEGLRALGVSRGLRVKLTVVARARPRRWAEPRVLEI